MQTQRKAREGFTDYNIVTHAKKADIHLIKNESLSKAFDLKRATNHNFQKSYTEMISAEPSVFRRTYGLCG